MDDRSRPPGAGKSSFDLVDPQKVFAPLNLRRGSVILDLGCGPGDYALYVARLIGDTGLVWAVDAWEEGIERLRERLRKEGPGNVRPLLADAAHLPVAEDSVDAVLMATVLHDLVEAGKGEAVLEEVRRVLRADGPLAIIEFDPVPGPPGPPIAVRLAPEAVERLTVPYGFRKEHSSRVGPYNYLIVFRCRKA